MLSTWHNVACRTAAGPHTLRYQRWTPDSGAQAGTVLCVHGLTRNSYDFERLAGALCDAGYQVIAPDIAGRGKSDRLPQPALYNYATYAADLQTLIAHERLQRVTWVGTSMGGILGMMLNAQAPGLIEKLVLNDVGAFIPKAALERIVGYVATPPRFRTLAEAEAYCRKTYAAFGLRSDDDWNTFTMNSVQEADDGFVMAYDPAIGAALAAAPLADVNLWPLWQRVLAPTLVVRGALSDVLSVETAAAMLLTPQATEVVFDDCGHAPSLMVPEQIGAVAAWVRDTACPPRTWKQAAAEYGAKLRAGLEVFQGLIQARRAR